MTDEIELVPMEAELIASTPDAGLLIERAARECYNSTDKMLCGLNADPCWKCPECPCAECTKRNHEFLSKLIADGHMSVFEHASATFRIVAPRSITHEIVRHRIASYSQSSTRYMSYENQPLKIVVDGRYMDTADNDTIIKHARASIRAYRALIATDVPIDKAREVLPNCTAATLVMTANFREWKHFITLRSAPNAHVQIQQLARSISARLHRILPCLFENMPTLPWKEAARTYCCSCGHRVFLEGMVISGIRKDNGEIICSYCKQLEDERKG